MQSSLHHFPPIFRHPHFNAMILHLQKLRFHYILRLISPSFICHPPYLPIFSSVPKVADNQEKILLPFHVSFIKCFQKSYKKQDDSNVNILLIVCSFSECSADTSFFLKDQHFLSLVENQYEQKVK